LVVAPSPEFLREGAIRDLTFPDRAMETVAGRQREPQAWDWLSVNNGIPCIEAIGMWRRRPQFSD